VHNAATYQTVLKSELLLVEKKMIFIEKLISIGSTPLASKPDSTLGSPIYAGNDRYIELEKMLALKNGFYAFESALHVFPAPASRVISPQSQLNLIEWNKHDLWRSEYDGLVDGLFFFAEDAFGVQFAIHGDLIVSFDPETGEIKNIASTLEGWAELILSDYPLMTGYPIAHAWQQINGMLQVGKRLLPKTPFILGGEFEINNLIAVDAVDGMRYRGELWRQLRDLPDGTQIRLSALPMH
jgi:hypothetical protein